MPVPTYVSVKVNIKDKSLPNTPKSADYAKIAAETAKAINSILDSRSSSKLTTKSKSSPMYVFTVDITRLKVEKKAGVDNMVLTGKAFVVAEGTTTKAFTADTTGALPYENDPTGDAIFLLSDSYKKAALKAIPNMPPL